MVMAVFLTIFMAISISVTHVSALNACPKCGNMEVPYPLSTDENCGDPRYKISCKNGILEFLSAEGSYYKTLSINPSAYKFIIRPPQIDRNTCYSSDVAVGGLRLDETSPFSISTRNTVMLFNCADNILLSPLNYSSNSLCRQFEEKVEEGSGCKNTLCCTYLKDSSFTSRKIRIRIGGCTAYTIVVDMNTQDPPMLWNYGVELQWLTPN